MDVGNRVCMPYKLLLTSYQDQPLQVCLLSAVFKVLVLIGILLPGHIFFK